MFLLIGIVICGEHTVENEIAPSFEFNEKSLLLVDFYINFGKILAEYKKAYRKNIDGLVDKIKTSESSGHVESDFRETMAMYIRKYSEWLSYDKMINPFIWYSDVFVLLKQNKVHEAIARIQDATETERNRSPCNYRTNAKEIICQIKYMNSYFMEECQGKLGEGVYFAKVKESVVSLDYSLSKLLELIKDMNKLYKNL